MCKIQNICACITLALIVCFPPISACAENNNNTLLVCENKEEAGELMQLIHACRRGADVVFARDYADGLASDYECLITTSPRPVADARAGNGKILMVGGNFASTEAVTMEKFHNIDITIAYRRYSDTVQFEAEAVLITKHTGSEFGHITASGDRSYPFAVIVGSEIYAPTFKPNSLSAIVLGELMQNFFGNDSEGKMYLLIDEVYAFSDLFALSKTADILYENAMPFIVRIMPIYDNLDYPAFLRYAQVLRYLQARNGTIVLHEPFIAETERLREPLEDKMERLHQALDREGVFEFDLEFIPYLLDLDTIYNIQSETKNFGALSLDTMISVPIFKQEEDLSDMIQKLNNKWFSIEDYKRNSTDANFQYLEIPVDEQFEYVVEERKTLVEQFAAGNEVLLIIVAICLTVLVVFIVMGHRVYKKKFIR